jgi:hypothetical protein
MNVRLHIDRLILEGIDVPHGGQAVRAAVEQELTRLIGEGGLPQQSIATPVIRAPQINVTTPSNLGPAIGRAVWGGLGGGK